MHTIIDPAAPTRSSYRNGLLILTPADAEHVREWAAKEEGHPIYTALQIETPLQPDCPVRAVARSRWHIDLSHDPALTVAGFVGADFILLTKQDRTPTTLAEWMDLEMPRHWSYRIVAETPLHGLVEIDPDDDLGRLDALRQEAADVYARHFYGGDATAFDVIDAQG